MDKGLNDDNNSIYNYSSAAKNFACLTKTSCRRKNVANSNFSPRNRHTHTHNSYYILKRGHVSKLEYLNPTQCKTASSSHLFAMETLLNFAHTRNLSLRSTSRRKRQLYCSTRFGEHIRASQYKKLPTPRTQTRRVDCSILLVTLEVKFKGLTA